MRRSAAARDLRQRAQRRAAREVTAVSGRMGRRMRGHGVAAGINEMCSSPVDFSIFSDYLHVASLEFQCSGCYM
jgi:hypothetical protein